MNTIAAICTPAGFGGIGVIRLSGPQAFEILLKLFSPVKPYLIPEHKKAVYGEIIENSKLLDRVVVTCFKSPHSYTGEDVAEISCHGGRFIVEKVLNAFLNAGAVMAGPGEYTERAFLNGKMDLMQAEAVEDLIYAESEKALEAAHALLSGNLSKKVETYKTGLISFLSSLEAEIEFPEESDVSDQLVFLTKKRIGELEGMIQETEDLCNSFENGMLIREGFHAAIIGAPNTGKSTLLNAILGYERALVSEVPGTTRDYIREKMMINGLPVTFVDTAGVRKNADHLERAGISQGQKILRQSNIILFVLDGSRAVHEDDLSAYANCPADIPLFCVLNKSDLPSGIDKAHSFFQKHPVIPISAFKGEGISDLISRMENLLRSRSVPEKTDCMVTHLRHKNALVKFRGALIKAKTVLSSGKGLELAAEELRNALGELGVLTGEITPEDVLHHIFSNFCIGK